jgi:hypothetical protein
MLSLKVPAERGRSAVDRSQPACVVYAERMRARFFSQLAVSPRKAQQISEAELFFVACSRQNLARR